MNTKFGDMSLYFGVITLFLAVGSTVHFMNYFRLKKRLLQAKKKTAIQDLRKESDKQFGLGWLAAVFTLIVAGLLIASLLI
jgi:NADH:ubiquinone oxidoreductase subunit 5 (subunit L)/multisubunit Na+/H+ antiporter MnhA subunit